jgi:chromosome segregation ATPase
MAEAKKRKPAALVAAEKRIAELENRLKNTEESKDIWYKRLQEEQRKIEELHAVFDAIPNAPARKFTGPNGYETEMSLACRFIAWLANK